MCQATIYLDGEKIMENVTRVEPTADGVRLATFFDPPQVVPAVIREIDLLEHRVVLEPLQEEKGHE